MNTPEDNSNKEKAQCPAWHKQVLLKTERLVKEGKTSTLCWQLAKQLLRDKQ